MSAAWMDLKDGNTEIVRGPRSVGDRLAQIIASLDQIQNGDPGSEAALAGGHPSQFLGDMLVIVRAVRGEQWLPATFARAAIAAGASAVLELAFAFPELLRDMLCEIGNEPWAEEVSAALVFLVPTWRLRLVRFLERFPDSYVAALCCVDPPVAARLILASPASWKISTSARAAIKTLPESAAKFKLLARACAQARDAEEDVVALAACPDVGLAVAALVACPSSAAFAAAWPRIRRRPELFEALQSPRRFVADRIGVNPRVVPSAALSEFAKRHRGSERECACLGEVALHLAAGEAFKWPWLAVALARQTGLALKDALALATIAGQDTQAWPFERPCADQAGAPAAAWWLLRILARAAAPSPRFCDPYVVPRAVLQWVAENAPTLDPFFHTCANGHAALQETPAPPQLLVGRASSAALERWRRSRALHPAACVQRTLWSMTGAKFAFEFRNVQQITALTSRVFRTRRETLAVLLTCLRDCASTFASERGRNVLLFEELSQWFEDPAIDSELVTAFARDLAFIDPAAFEQWLRLHTGSGLTAAMETATA